MVIDVSDATFATEVLERSKQLPVVVDFWAPWCGPCRVLGPVIEQVASEHGDDVVLVKLNTDENPAVASQFHIQSIPAVKAFVDGEVAADFVGAVPEAQVRQFFARVLPSPADRAVQAARELRPANPEEALRVLRDAVAAEPAHTDAVLALASMLIEDGETDEAGALLDRAPNDRRVKVLQHRIFLAAFARAHAVEELQREAEDHPDDPRTRYRWGVMLAAQGEYGRALEELLESVRLDRAVADGAARKAMLAVFDIVGVVSPLAREYQQRLASVLF
jgi:putative thioredoxin